MNYQNNCTITPRSRIILLKTREKKRHPLFYLQHKKLGKSFKRDEDEHFCSSITFYKRSPKLVYLSCLHQTCAFTLGRLRIYFKQFSIRVSFADEQMYSWRFNPQMSQRILLFGFVRASRNRNIQRSNIPVILAEDIIILAGRKVKQGSCLILYVTYA